MAEETDRADLSIVVPAHNEAQRIVPTLESARNYAQTAGRHCELIVVDDGSRDGTADIVRAFDPGPLQLSVLVNPQNRGKGYTVRRGVLASRGGAVLMCDADLDTPVEEVDKLLPWLQRGNAVVIGSRLMPDSLVWPPRPISRRFAAWVFRTIRRTLILPRLHDTQCGFKLFSRAAADAIFSRQRIEGYAFDCEVLALADVLGFSTAEVGVRWTSQPNSHVRVFHDGWRMLRDVWRIRQRIARARSPIQVPEEKP